MRYLLLYRRCPEKSILNASAQQINRMPEDERAKYDQIPMTGTLEEVVRDYVAGSKMKRAKIASIAKALGLPTEKILRPKSVAQYVVRHGDGWTSVTAIISTETKKQIEEYKSAHGLKSTSEAVDSLLQIALGPIQK